MVNLLFIHGAWHWSGCWYKVINSELLNNYKAHALDNPMNGFNKEYSAENFELYTSEIQNLLKTTNEKFIIIAHSIGGSIASFIANKFPKKIEKIIYVAASICAENQCAVDYFMKEYYLNFMKELGLENSVIPDAHGKIIKLNMTDKEKIIKLFYNQSSNSDIEIALKNLSEFSSGIPFTQKHNYCDEFYPIKKVYVECTNDNAMPISMQREMQSNFSNIKTYTLNTDHSPFFSKNKELSKIIKKEI